MQIYVYSWWEFVICSNLCPFSELDSFMLSCLFEITFMVHKTFKKKYGKKFLDYFFVLSLYEFFGGVFKWIQVEQIKFYCLSMG